MDFTTIILLVLLVVILALCIFAVFWFGWMLPPLVGGGGPYVPSRMSRVETMIKLANITPQDITADFGSGDGRVVIAAAKAGAKMSIGYEVHPGLVMRSRALARQAGVYAKTNLLWKSMWKADVRDADVIFLYQIPYAMKRIGRLLDEQLKPGARIVSNGFILPDWTPVAEENSVRVYIKS